MQQTVCLPGDQGSNSLKRMLSNALQMLNSLRCTSTTTSDQHDSRHPGFPRHGKDANESGGGAGGGERGQL